METLTRPCPFGSKDVTIPKVIISLKEHERKLNVFKDRYRNAGFSLDELFFMEGFNGKQMKEPPPMTLRQLEDMGQERYDHRFFNRPGGYGCYLSHAQAWKWIADSNKPAMIFEDDAFFPFGKHTAKACHEKIHQMISSNSSPPPMLLLGYNEIPGRRHTQKLPSRVPRQFVDVKDVFHGLQGYLVTPQAARFMLSKAFPIEMQVDSFLGLLAKHYQSSFKILAMKDPLITQSNITGTSVQTKCTLCNGKVNGSRLEPSSLRERNEFCAKSGLCHPLRSKRNHFPAVTAALAACCFIILKPKKK